MSSRVQPPPGQTAGNRSFAIAWWQANRSDECERCRAVVATQVEAEMLLSLLTADLANTGIQCSWLEPEALADTPLPF